MTCGRDSDSSGLCRPLFMCTVGPMTERINLGSKEARGTLGRYAHAYIIR